MFVVILFLHIVNYMCDALPACSTAECLADGVDKGQLHENLIGNSFSKAKGNYSYGRITISNFFLLIESFVGILWIFKYMLVNFA